jgi:hypothetical protein
MVNRADGSHASMVDLFDVGKGKTFEKIADKTLKSLHFGGLFGSLVT